MFKKNTILNAQAETIEVMALFGFEMTPCQPLSFKRTDGREFEIDELIRTRIKFSGPTVKHIFDVTAAGRKFRLEFDSASLVWELQLI